MTQVTKFANLLRMPANSKARSPVGTTVASDSARRAAQNATYRAVEHQNAVATAVAHEVILARGKLGLTQEELARAAGTTKSAISRLECARQLPSLRTLARIAQALDADLSITLRPRDVAA